MTGCYIHFKGVKRKIIPKLSFLPFFTWSTETVSKGNSDLSLIGFSEVPKSNKIYICKNFQQCFVKAAFISCKELKD